MPNAANNTANSGYINPNNLNKAPNVIPGPSSSNPTFD